MQRTAGIDDGMQCGLCYVDVHATGDEARSCVRPKGHEGECVIYNRRFERWVACEPDPECGSDPECECEAQGFDCFLWRELTEDEAAALRAYSPALAPSPN
jgi:hypothetical protein